MDFTESGAGCVGPNCLSSVATEESKYDGRGKLAGLGSCPKWSSLRGMEAPKQVSRCSRPKLKQITTLTPAAGTLESGTLRETDIAAPPRNLPPGILGDEEIQEFVKIWQEEFQETLSPDAARYQASLLLELYLLLYRSRGKRPLPAEGAFSGEPK
jgi:hypothetical protein